MALISWLDRNLEKIVILIAYITMAGIIFVEVIRRYLFGQQAAWSTTIPIYLFLWITWIGCAYNVKLRAHLNFAELRVRMPYAAQFACLMLDAALWIGFGSVVLVFAIEQVQIAHMNFAIVQGTDNVMKWWFYLATPIGWSLLVVRVIQALWADIGRYRRGEPFQLSGTVMSD